jgi:two-component system phosphate regulon response regulator PhoB
MQRVLIVEDDADLSTVVEFNLRREGFTTAVADTGSRALRLARQMRPDLIILDLMLPDLQGVDVCREVRQDAAISSTPIIIVTARGQESDRLMGLEAGADDYLVKPFVVRELVLRARAVLRRADVGVNAHSTGSIVVDESSHRVYVDGKETPLTNTEYKLLLLFLQRPGKVLTRELLLSHVWNMPGTIVTRTVDTHVKRLREKLGDSGRSIETVRSVGYRFVVEDGAEAPTSAAIVEIN